MKLSEEKKHDITKLAIEHVFGEEEKAMLKQAEQDSLKYYLGNGEKLYEDVPSDWTDYVYQKSYVHLTITRNNYEWKKAILLQRKLAVNLNQRDNGIYNMYPGWQKFSKEDYPLWTHPFIELTERMNEYRELIEKLLVSIKTDKQLRDIAPNLSQFLPIQEISGGEIISVSLLEAVESKLRKNV